MSQSKGRRSNLGKIIRKLREQQAKSRDDLADEASIWPRTLQEIERGKRSPQHRTLKKIATALKVPTEMLSRDSKAEIRNPATERAGLVRADLSTSMSLKLIAARFIPVYIGQNNDIHDSDVDIFRDETTEEIIVHRFDDNFAVIELIDALEFTSVIEMLTKRRERHLSILNTELAFMNNEKDNYDSILSLGNNKAEYVMSVHQLVEGSQCDEAIICAMCLPSLAGITDDPNDIQSEDCHVDELYIDINEMSYDIDRAKFKNCCYYAGWSNVILLDRDEAHSNFDVLRKLEVHLQKLWFQTYLYDHAIDRALKQLNLSLRTRLMEDIYDLILSIHNFTRINSVGSGHMNQLKRALVRTSHLLELCEGLKRKVNVLKTLS